METRKTIKAYLLGYKDEMNQKGVMRILRMRFNLWKRIELFLLCLNRPDLLLLRFGEDLITFGYHLGLKDAAEIIEKRKEQNHE